MTQDYASRQNGPFLGVPGWHDLDALSDRVRAQPEGWYASLVGEAVPDVPLPVAALDPCSGYER